MSEGNNQIEKDESAERLDAKKQRKAFFITPLGSETSEIRRATNGLIEAVVRPTLERHNIKLIPPHEINDPGTITRQIVRHILTSDLIVANLTGLNPNVMYELAISHAKRLPVIIIAEEGTKLPFDLIAERTIFYSNDMAGVVILSQRLDETIPRALEDSNPENPIYNGIESQLIIEQVKNDNNPFESYVLDRLDKLSSGLLSIQNNTKKLSLESPQRLRGDSVKYFVNFSERLSDSVQHKLLNAFTLGSLPVHKLSITDSIDMKGSYLSFIIDREVNPDLIRTIISTISVINQDYTIQYVKYDE